MVSSWLACFCIACSCLLLLLRRICLPKPLPGIPYNPSAARSLLGDLPRISFYLRQDGNNTLVTYFHECVRDLNAPLVQVFLKPLARPTLLLSDFREARHLLMHSPQFDRSPALKGLLSGIIPDHHIHLATDEKWAAQRRVVQDLMTPSFLHEVAGPAFYTSIAVGMDAWSIKSSLAGERPWDAGADVRNVSLDAMCALAFGTEPEVSAIIPLLESLRNMQQSSTGIERDPS
ncbi:MAG: hypothetical protein M1828_001118 [Chrysothrix sp. TS-e1954]|nr:MAG: hypothetical protein M1828_001118 [Chrysothrix sp. TS-e1954]